MTKQNSFSNTLSVIGAYSLLLFVTFSTIPRIFKRRNLLFQQLIKTGYESIPLIFVTSAFTGLVSAVQALFQTREYIPPNLIGVMIGKTTMIEVAPILTALVLTGKVGAAMAAEIGTMKVTEQIDAMKSLGINPYDYLFLPRIIAGMIVFPILTILSNFVTVISAYLLVNFRYGITTYDFFVNLKSYFRPVDLWGGLVKSIFFGIMITSLSCYIGYRAEGGAEGVGRVTTLTVIYSTMFILLTDFLFAVFLYGVN